MESRTRIRTRFRTRIRIRFRIRIRIRKLAGGVIMDRPLRPLATMLRHLLTNLLWGFLTLVLITLLTLLVRHLPAFWNLDIFALLVWNLCALFPTCIVHMAFFSVGGCTLLLALRCAHLFISSVTLWFLMSLAVFLKLVINQHVLICSAVLTLLSKFLDRFEEWDRVAGLGRDVSASLLWDCQALWNLYCVALLFWNLLAFLLLLIAAHLFWHFCTLFPMVSGAVICWCFVNRFALFAVFSFTFFLLLLVADVLVCGFALFLVLVFTFNIFLSLALGLDDILADLPCGRNTGLHIVISAPTATEQVYHIVSCAFGNDSARLCHCLRVQGLPTDEVAQHQEKCTLCEDHLCGAVALDLISGEPL